VLGPAPQPIVARARLWLSAEEIGMRLDPDDRWFIATNVRRSFYLGPELFDPEMDGTLAGGSLPARVAMRCRPSLLPTGGTRWSWRR